MLELDAGVQMVLTQEMLCVDYWLIVVPFLFQATGLWC